MSSRKRSTQDKTFGKDNLRRMGKFIETHRILAGLSQQDAAARSGVAVTTLRALEAGQSSPSLTTVLAVVQSLGLSLDHVIAQASARRVVVSRRSDSGEQAISDALSQARMRARDLLLTAETPRRAAPGKEEGPIFCMVTEGCVEVELTDGRRMRMQSGDVHLGEAGQVLAWRLGDSGQARLLCVTETHDRRFGAG